MFAPSRNGDDTDFIMALMMANRARDADNARVRQSRRDAHTKARLAGALRSSRSRVEELEQELKLERGRRLQRELIETRRALYG